MRNIGYSDIYAPKCIKEIKGPYIRRQVWLKTGDDEKYGYAISWWNSAEVHEYLKNKAIPIWQSLNLAKTETHRDIRGQLIYLSSF